VIPITIKIWNRRPQTKSGRGRPAESKIGRLGLDHTVEQQLTASDAVLHLTPSKTHSLQYAGNKPGLTSPVRRRHSCKPFTTVPCQVPCGGGPAPSRRRLAHSMDVVGSLGQMRQRVAGYQVLLRRRYSQTIHDSPMPNPCPGRCRWLRGEAFGAPTDHRGTRCETRQKVFGAPALEATRQRRWRNSVPGFPSKKHKRQRQQLNIRKAAAPDTRTGHSIKNNRFVYVP